MKTDMFILQVVDKVKKDHHLHFRGINDQSKSKNFLERYTAYAITNSRKAMMQNLKRNAPLVTNNNGKRMKKKIITYNPDVHIKKEKPDQEHSVLNLEIVEDGASVQETSTITMDKSGEDVKASIMEAFVQYFNSGGDSLKSSEDFLFVWRQQMGHTADVLANSAEMGSRMPSLPRQTQPVECDNVTRPTTMTENVDVTTNNNDDSHNALLSNGNEGTVDIELTATKDQDSIGENGLVTAPQDRSNNDSGTGVDGDRNNEDFERLNDLNKYEGGHHCGDCDMIFYNCSTHNHSSLLKEYGPGMRCVGKECGKTLYHCLNEIHKDMRGAFICQGCQERKCRQMKCNVCYFREAGNGRGRRNRQSKV